ncbi:MAG: C-GCAxxG-C-C family protein [Nitrososphaerota archaeon]
MGLEKSELAYELAYKYEARYGGCAQTTFAGIMDALEKSSVEAFKAATGLAAGIGCSTEGTCGAVIGGAMAISVLFGREREEFEDPKKKRFLTYKMVNEFLEAFKNTFGTIKCSEIQKKMMGKTFNLLNPSEFDEFLKLGGHTDKCPFVAGTGAKLAVETILKNFEELR